MQARAEKIEAGLIGVATVLVGLVSTQLPASLATGTLIAVAALALLLQGSFRDLWLICSSRGQKPPTESAACLCLESTIGLGGVLIGLALTLAGIETTTIIKPQGWTVLALLVWSFGFATKDIVLQWNPWALRRIKNHGAIIVRLR